MTGQRSPGRNNGSFGMNGMSGMSGMNGMGRNGRLSSRGIGVQQAVRPVIQISLDTPSSLEPTTISEMTRTHLTTNQSVSSLQGVQVNLDTTGVATVRGVAANNRERILAAAMLSMEPGVREVRNEITLPPTPSLPAGR